MLDTPRLAELREEAKVTRGDLAKRLGVHERTVQRWETGESRIPEARLSELAKLFRVSRAYMLGWEDAA